MRASVGCVLARGYGTAVGNVSQPKIFFRFAKLCKVLTAALEAVSKHTKMNFSVIDSSDAPIEIPAFASTRGPMPSVLVAA